MATTRTKPSVQPRAPEAASPAPHFIVCGQDELGFRAAEELNRLGEPVVFIANAVTGRFVTSLVERGVSVVRGNYREDKVLIDAGIESARALIIAESDDIGNLHAALAAHELNPNLRVVLRIFNGELGRRVQDLLQDCEVLSSSTIAAPAFVAAALQSDFEQSIEAEGTVLVVRHGNVGDPGVLMAIAGEDDAGEIVLFPESGESVLCLADGQVAIGRNLVSHAVRQARRRRLPPGLLAAGHLVRALADNRVRYLVACVAALVLVSMLIFHFFAHLSYLDSMYFTVVTITTIGYGDISMLGQAAPLKIYNIVLALLGAASMAIFFAVITDTLVGARLREAMGGIRREMSDHVVVCGVGNIGHRVVEQVHAMGLAVVAMDVSESAKAIPELRRQGIPIVIGDAGELPNLEALCLETARCLVVTTDDDMTNLEVALAARSINPELRIVLQLHDPDLAAKIQRAIGIGVSRSSAGLAAPAFVSSALGHRILGSIPVGERMVVVAHADVVGGSEAAGQNVEWLQADLYGRVLMLGRAGRRTWCPPNGTGLEAGDRLLLVATRKGLDGFLKRAETVAEARSGQSASW
jgi:voltage-gated potassium channel Kch